MNPAFLLYTRDMEGLTRFYTALGFTVRRTQRGGGWTELVWGTFTLNLHGHRGELPPTGRLLLGFETDDLDAAAQRLVGSGINLPAIMDEAFGRLLHLTDPDGNAVSVVQNEPELYA